MVVKNSSFTIPKLQLLFEIAKINIFLLKEILKIFSRLYKHYRKDGY